MDRAVIAAARPYIDAALKHDPGRRTFTEVMAIVDSGDARLWLGERCAVVTEWLVYPRQKALNIWLMGGDLDELLGPMLCSIEAWAKQNGAAQIVGGAVDRRGWALALGRKGFAPRWTMLAKDLNPMDSTQ